MNTLASDTQAAIVRALVEGNSLRATARLCGVARETVSSLLKNLGAHAKNHHDRFVVNVRAKRIQADEIWSFNYCKEKNVAPEEKGQGKGDVWTWVAIDPDSKLVVSYKVGSRDGDVALAFMHDLADRLMNRVQLTTDALHAYLEAVESAFGADVDFARIIKVFRNTSGSNTVDRRYSPGTLVRTEKEVVMGSPDLAKASTSINERQNLTMRMVMRRFTRLTNGFSKKVEYHLYAVALHYAFYNWCRPHTTLTKGMGKPTTPAMAAGLTDRVWTIYDLLDLLQGN